MSFLRIPVGVEVKNVRAGGAKQSVTFLLICSTSYHARELQTQGLRSRTAEGSLPYGLISSLSSGTWADLWFVFLSFHVRELHT